MTEQTKTYNTPWTRVEEAYESETFYPTRDAFLAEREAHYMGTMTREEAIRAAKEAMPHGKAQTTKQAACRVLARLDWYDHPVYKHYHSLVRKADAERSIIREMEQAPKHHQQMLARVTELVASESAAWEAERIARYCVDLHRFAQEARLWAYVANRVQDGDSPLEALTETRERVLTEFLRTGRFRSDSKSTSIIANLMNEATVEAEATWLDETKRLARGD